MVFQNLSPHPHNLYDNLFDNLYDNLFDHLYDNLYDKVKSILFERLQRSKQNDATCFNKDFKFYTGILILLLPIF